MTLVSVIMGSDSDWPTMRAAADALAELDGLDSLLSIVQMPAGVPVATVSIGGARNAGLLAVRILAAADDGLRARMLSFQDGLRALVAEKDATLRTSL